MNARGLSFTAFIATLLGFASCRQAQSAAAEEVAPAAIASADPLARPVTLKRNGGWCWFQDERVIVAGGKLVFGSVAGTNGAGSDRGDVEVTAVDLQTRDQQSFKLHPRFQSDDHDVPALLELPDGRILATYQTHGGAPEISGTDLMRWRRTARPGDVSEWSEEQTLPVGASVSYSNLFKLGSEDGRIYLFHRGFGFNPNYLISDDDGLTFRYGGRLLTWPKPVGNPGYTGIDGGRPYVKYAQQGQDTVHVVTTEDHPRAFDNGIYHGFIRSGKWHGSDGREIAPLSQTRETPMKPTDLTCVFRGDADHVAWMCDMHLDRDGHPHILFSVQRGGSADRGQRKAGSDGQDHRFHHARWDGTKWLVHEIAHAGRRLYSGEDDYTGLGAIVPHEPATVFISTDAHPDTGAPLVSATDGRRHWEIFRGLTKDAGTTWTWSPVTQNSTADNLRPIVPISPDSAGHPIVLWLRGSYRSYTDYELDVVGLLPETGAQQ